MFDDGLCCEEAIDDGRASRIEGPELANCESACDLSRLCLKIGDLTEEMVGYICSS